MWARVRREDVISEEYLALQVAMHLTPQGYGQKGSRWADAAVSVARQFQCGSVLDYGCGRGSLRCLLEEHGLVCREYDPAVEGKDQMPVPADLVVCTDVLEHVEMEKLPKVLQHIGSLAKRAIFLVVALKPSVKTLGDGRNAHITLRPSAWWEAQVDQQCWMLESVDIPMHGKVNPDKFWIGVARPS